MIEDEGQWLVVQEEEIQREKEHVERLEQMRVDERKKKGKNESKRE